CIVCDKLTAVKHRAVNKFKIEPHFGGVFALIVPLITSTQNGEIWFAIRLGLSILLPSSMRVT
ncbi:hypothetical protein, partial [Providencia hangzhouensis]